MASSAVNIWTWSVNLCNCCCCCSCDIASATRHPDSHGCIISSTNSSGTVGPIGNQKKKIESQVGESTGPVPRYRCRLERYKFGFVTWIGAVDPSYPDLLKKSQAEKDEVATVELCEVDEQLSTNLFAILVGQCRLGEIPAMAMLVPDRNGLELWRRMYARFEPENKHKPFPTQHSQQKRVCGSVVWKNGTEKLQSTNVNTANRSMKI